MNASLKSAVFGATGYSGFELVRLLARHPGASKPILVRRNGESGGYADLSEAYPQLAGNGGFPFQNFSWQQMKNAGVDVVFFATPHEFSRELAPEAIAQGFRVIDLSGAWRLKQTENRAVYGFAENPEDAPLDVLRFTVCLSCTPVKSKCQAPGQSRLLRDFDHPGAGAVDSRRLRRCRAWRHLRFQVGRLGSREDAIDENPFRGS
jgi:hypothetical protein